MNPQLETKLKGMLWDMSPGRREEIFRKIVSDPSGAFSDDNILIKALNTLTWYELIELTGHEKLCSLLSEKVIQMLFPSQRRKFYSDAKRLLSKYSLSSSGQDS